MKNYILFWIGGKSESISGNSFDHAFLRAGYGAGALRALDYYKEIMI
jgi:hypothetical protein